MAIQKLTNEFCASIKHNGSKYNNCYYDTEIKRFYLEVRPKNGKTFNLKYQDSTGKTRVIKIGTFDSKNLTAGIARKRVKALKSEIELGKDPYAEKMTHKKTPTLNEFYKKHYLPHKKQRNRSWETTDSVFRIHILPLWGDLKMNKISLLMVTEAHNNMLEKGFKPATANKVPTFLRGVINLALKWKIPGITTNPLENFEMFDENNKIERYLSVEESERLLEYVKQSENKLLKYIIPFLLLTGARRSEALKSKWSHFDFEHLLWIIPAELSKSKKDHPVPITPALFNLIQQIPRADNPYLFPSPKTGKPYNNIYQSWNTARVRAGLADVRMHDLRHTYASSLVNQGVSLYAVQQLLGHSNVSVTMRYAHLSKDSLMNAANCASILVPEKKA